jgi:hypothetical protein
MYILIYYALPEGSGRVINLSCDRLGIQEAM